MKDVSQTNEDLSGDIWGIFMYEPSHQIMFAIASNIARFLDVKAFFDTLNIEKARL